MSEFPSPVWGTGIGAGGTAITAGALIYAALRDLTVLRPGQTPSPEALEDGLAALNLLVDAWSQERLLVTALEREVLPVAQGAVSAEIGTERVEHASFLEAEGRERPIEVYALERWRRAIAAGGPGWPAGIYVENTGPTLVVHLGLVSDEARDLVLYRWRALAMFGDYQTEHILARGYPRALRYGLAVEMMPQFRALAKIPDVLYETLLRQAAEAKAAVKRTNLPSPEFQMDPALMRQWY